MSKVVIYSRVSTDEQREKGFSLSDQKKRLNDFCQTNQWQIIHHYEDDCSAKNFNRPQFQMFLNDLKSKKIKPDYLLCIRTDRFSRNLEESMKMINRLRNYGVILKFVEGNYDLSTPENMIPYVLSFLLPQVDNDRRGLNTRRGMREAMKQGRWVSTPPFGYEKENLDKALKLIPNKDAWLVKKAFDEYSKGIYSMDELRLKLNSEYNVQFKKSNFEKILRNIVYAGKIRIHKWNDEPEMIVDGIHEPIVSFELFCKVQDVLSGRYRNQSKPKTRDENLPLRGHLICPICCGTLTGSRSTGRNKDVKHYYYHCQRGCKFRIKTKVAHDNLSDLFQQMSCNKSINNVYKEIAKDVFKDKEEERNKMVREIENDITQVTNRIKAAENSLLDGVINHEKYNQISERLESELRKLQEKKQLLSLSVGQYDKLVNYGLNLVTNLGSMWELMNIDQRQRVLGSIFPEKLVVTEKNYRTAQPNEVMSFIFNIDKAFRESEKEKADISVGLSTMAPPLGLEPRTP